MRQLIHRLIIRPLVKQNTSICSIGPLKTAVDVLIVPSPILVAFGLEILKIIPGRVSTEVPASLSFDAAGTIAKAEDLIKIYE